MPRSSLARAALALTLGLFACSRGSVTAVTTQPQSSAGPASPNPAPPANIEEQVLPAVSKALRGHKLLTRPDQCYAYRFDTAPGKSAYTVEVRENHAHPECGGDPQTQPHLFTVQVDKTSRALSSDAQSPGTFQPLQP